MHNIDRRTRSASLSVLKAQAVGAGVPDATATDAQNITAARFMIRGLDAALTERARAYFWGVVRRRALRGGAPVLRSSMVALSLASELAEAGFEPDEVRRQVAGTFGEASLRLIEPAIAGPSAA